MAKSWLARLLPAPKRNSYLRNVVTGSMFRLSDIRGNTAIADIHTQIDTMRALARDSQISTALSYYATDATIPNSKDQIIWASSDKEHEDVANIINQLFKKWKVNLYARDHILELATVGNLYIPTTDMYKEESECVSSSEQVALDNNTIPSLEYDIVPSTKIPPEDIVHLWHMGVPQGYIYQPSDDIKQAQFISYPESAVIHFSLGGLLGDYTLDVTNQNGDIDRYDIQFSTPLMSSAVTPTQTLSLLEDALLLTSLTRVVKFINVEAGTDEEEIRETLTEIKDAIEQQLSINTNTGDTESFVNPQSPNNLIYLPKVNGQDAISVTDLNMAESNAEDSKLLEHYMDKKLSVLGVPKEAMNFSSNEGLGGAGSVLSQRSALYANSLKRLETAYKEGWRDAINKYFLAKNMSGFVDAFELHMEPIITQQSTIIFDKRDAALTQATSFVELLKTLGVDDSRDYVSGIVEILSEVFPGIGAESAGWDISPVKSEGEGGSVDDF